MTSETFRRVRILVVGWCSGVWAMLGMYNHWAYGISGTALAFGIWLVVPTSKAVKP